MGDGDCVQLISRNCSLLQNLFHCNIHSRLVRFHGKIWHHAAPGCVDLCLREKGFSQHTAACRQKRNAGVITAAFNPKYKFFASCCVPGANDSDNATGSRHT